MAESKIGRVLLVGDAKKGGSAEVIREYAAWLERRGVETEQVTDREAPLRDLDADVVVVWGGDGSLLAAARRMGCGRLTAAAPLSALHGSRPVGWQCQTQWLW